MKRTELDSLWELYCGAKRQKLPKFLMEAVFTDERLKDSLFMGFCMGYRLAKARSEAKPALRWGKLQKEEARCIEQIFPQ